MRRSIPRIRDRLLDDAIDGKFLAALLAQQGTLSSCTGRARPIIPPTGDEAVKLLIDCLAGTAQITRSDRHHAFRLDVLVRRTCAIAESGEGAPSAGSGPATLKV